MIHASFRYDVLSPKQSSVEFHTHHIHNNNKYDLIPYVLHLNFHRNCIFLLVNVHSLYAISLLIYIFHLLHTNYRSKSKNVERFICKFRTSKLIFALTVFTVVNDVFLAIWINHDWIIFCYIMQNKWPWQIETVKWWTESRHSRFFHQSKWNRMKLWNSTNSIQL